MMYCLWNLEVECMSRFSCIQKWNQGIGSVPITESLQQGKIASLCYNWNRAYTSANYLLPWDINFSLQQLNVGSCRPIHNIFIFVVTHARLDIVMVVPKPMLNIVGGRKLLLFVCWSIVVTFASSHFGIAQRSYNDLHCPISFSRVGWQPYNVPLGIRVIDFQHRCGTCHTMPCIIQWLL